MAPPPGQTTAARKNGKRTIFFRLFALINCHHNITGPKRGFSIHLFYSPPFPRDERTVHPLVSPEDRILYIMQGLPPLQGGADGSGDEALGRKPFIGQLQGSEPLKR